MPKLLKLLPMQQDRKHLKQKLLPLLLLKLLRPKELRLLFKLRFKKLLRSSKDSNKSKLNSPLKQRERDLKLSD
jgi:hypothetical protein